MTQATIKQDKIHNKWKCFIVFIRAVFMIGVYKVWYMDHILYCVHDITQGF